MKSPTRTIPLPVPIVIRLLFNYMFLFRFFLLFILVHFESFLGICCFCVLNKPFRQWLPDVFQTFTLQFLKVIGYYGAVVACMKRSSKIGQVKVK
jgi:hypothetical protein